MPRRPEEAKELLPSVKRMSEQLGLRMIKPPFIPCTRPALEAAEYAKEHGSFEQFHLAVFKAYLEDGKNIGLRSILRDIAERCGLDADELEVCLDEGRYAERINIQNKEARELGLSVIPSYIIGRHLIEGARPYEIFQSVMTRV